MSQDTALPKADHEPPTIKTMIVFAAAKSAVGAIFVLAITAAYLIGDDFLPQMPGRDRELLQMLASIALIAPCCAAFAVIAHKKPQDAHAHNLRRSSKLRLFSVYTPLIFAILLIVVSSRYADLDVGAILVFILFWEIFQNSIDSAILWSITR